MEKADYEKKEEVRKNEKKKFGDKQRMLPLPPHCAKRLANPYGRSGT
jgi:hypothetical protein